MTFATRPFQGCFGEVQAVKAGAGDGFFRESHDGAFYYTVYGCDPAGACPQCGCSFATHLSAEKLRKRYGDAPNVEMECGERMLKYSTPMADPCPEWDKECQLKAK